MELVGLGEIERLGVDDKDCEADTEREGLRDIDGVMLGVGEGDNTAVP